MKWIYVVELNTPNEVKREGFEHIEEARRFAREVLLESVQEKNLWQDSKVEMDSFKSFLETDDLDDAIELWRESLGYQEDLTINPVPVNESQVYKRNGVKTRVVPASELDAVKGLRAKDYIKEPGRFRAHDYLVLSLHEIDYQSATVAIRHVAAQCFQTAVDKGWWEKYGDTYASTPKKWLPEVISSKIALMHSELSEALEELRNRKDYGLKSYFSQPIVTVGDKSEPTGRRALFGVEEGLHRNAKPEGMAAELADAVIRILDLAAWLELDIAEAIIWKMRYNRSRSHKHGGKSI